MNHGPLWVHVKIYERVYCVSADKLHALCSSLTDRLARAHTAATALANECSVNRRPSAMCEVEMSILWLLVRTEKYEYALFDTVGGVERDVRRSDAGMGRAYLSCALGRNKNVLHLLTRDAAAAGRRGRRFSVIATLAARRMQFVRCNSCESLGESKVPCTRRRQGQVATGIDDFDSNDLRFRRELSFFFPFARATKNPIYT